MNDTQPHYVEYNLKDDAHAIEFYRNCAVKHGPDILLHTNKIGVNKKEYWSFQREVRFVIRGMSVDENGCIIDEPVKRAEFYIQLKQDVLKKMEIVLGPKTGDGERSIAEALVYNTFQENHNIQIKNSIVKIR